jgi:predicted RNase H-related nuclease YkuK (DUF458 family)
MSLEDVCARVSEARSVNSGKKRATLVQHVEKLICVGVDSQNEKNMTLHLGIVIIAHRQQSICRMQWHKPSAKADQEFVQGVRNISSIGNAFWISLYWHLVESDTIENKISAREENGNI